MEVVGGFDLARCTMDGCQQPLRVCFFRSCSLSCSVLALDLPELVSLLGVAEKLNLSSETSVVSAAAQQVMHLSVLTLV
jgi:hypothetical protein